MKSLQIASAAAAVAALISVPAQAQMTVGGDVETNIDYVGKKDGGADDDYAFGGRVQLAVSGSTEGTNGTLSGKTAIMAGNGGSVSIDDMWVRLARDNWGVQIGRFEGMDLFSKGTDTIHRLIPTTNSYTASAARGRMSNTGQIMFDVTMGGTRMELMTIYGEAVATEDEAAISGFRPAVAFTVTDDLNVSLGYDYLETGDTEVSGFGIYARYATDAFALKFNVATGESETNGNTDWENTSMNVNVESGRFGLGYTISSDDQDGGDEATTLYGRYYIPNLMGVESASASIGLSIADADSADDTETALRYRINYSF